VFVLYLTGTGAAIKIIHISVIALLPAFHVAIPASEGACICNAASGDEHKACVATAGIATEDEMLCRIAL
jgi:hypothetical protein